MMNTAEMKLEKIDMEQLEEVTGGAKKGAPQVGLKSCIGPTYEHDFVKTDAHREVDVLPFGIGGWTNGEDGYVCVRCGYKVWSHDKP